MPKWRLMTQADLSGVSAVADVVHPGLPESPEMLAERLTLYPQGCRVLARENGPVLGYAISHPIVPFEPPALDTLLGGISQAARQYYIHDIALNPDLRGGGYARPVIEDLLAVARSFDSCALVSVYGTAAFWARFGFAESRRDMAAKLAPYGAGAVFMTRPAEPGA